MTCIEIINYKCASHIMSLDLEKCILMLSRKLDDRVAPI